MNHGDTQFGAGSGNDVIISGEGDDENNGDSLEGEGSGGADIFVCGGGEDTVTDYNVAEGDIAAPDCENI